MVWPTRFNCLVTLSPSIFLYSPASKDIVSPAVALSITFCIVLVLEPAVTICVVAFACNALSCEDVCWYTETSLIALLELESANETVHYQLHQLQKL